MFDANISRLIGKYRFRGLLLDANLLLLLAIGSYSTVRIATFKRTAAYSVEDYRLLLALIARFDRLVTTPNILTEVDNLGRQLPQHEHGRFALVMRNIVSTSLEVVRPSSQVVALGSFERLGLSDALSTTLARECLIVSDDLALYAQLTNTGHDAINFSHLRG
jgi:hypothetical protein